MPLNTLLFKVHFKMQLLSISRAKTPPHKSRSSFNCDKLVCACIFCIVLSAAFITWNETQRVQHHSTFKNWACEQTVLSITFLISWRETFHFLPGRMKLSHTQNDERKAHSNAKSEPFLQCKLILNKVYRWQVTLEQFPQSL